MDLSKKEIIYKLAKGVINSAPTAQRYGIQRRKLTESAGISEIALYSAVAEHIEENDISPESMVDDMQRLIDGCIENSFFIKTDDSFSFLLPSFNDLLMRNNPPEESKFLCNKCFLIKTKKEVAKNKNYKSTCECCVVAIAKSDVPKRKYTKRKQAIEAETVEEVNKVSEEPSGGNIPQLIRATIEPIEIEPFITLKSMMADADTGTIELSVGTPDMLKLLSVIDDLLIREEKKEEEE